jgi:hypothetical protein
MVTWGESYDSILVINYTMVRKNKRRWCKKKALYPLVKKEKELKYVMTQRNLTKLTSIAGSLPTNVIFGWM